MKKSEISQPLKNLIANGGKVSQLDPGFSGKVTVHPVYHKYRHHGRFYVTEDGKVYADRRLYLLESWGANEAQRSLWCRLAGVKVAELKAYRKFQADQEARSKAAKELAGIRAKAEGYGFKLTKRAAK